MDNADHEQADEKILTYTASDEALETAADTTVGKGGEQLSWSQGLTFPVC
jgi:hypothetical protein